MYSNKPSQGKIKLLTVFLSVILIILIIAFLFLKQLKANYFASIYTPFDAKNNTPILFQVESNANIKLLTKRLQKEGFIKNDFFLWWYLRSNNLIPNIQAGTHYLSPSYTYEEIAAELSKARPEEVSITIPEGYTIAQIDERLTKKEYIQAGEFIQTTQEYNTENYGFVKLKSLEGYLFPDTYRLYAEHISMNALITKMLQNFEQKIDNIYDTETNTRTLAEILIMASIIEKETNDKDNRAIVAGILWKRLDIGMMLGADATTRYGINKLTEDLTYADLDSDSPYNTRKFRGLPPGPICNPGLASLKASIEPEESEYLYYLHDANGDIHYAKTNEEHNENKAKFL